MKKWEAGPRTIGPFKVPLHDVNYEIDPRSIHVYLNVGCGDGDITAAIGAYFRLMKCQIFGAVRHSSSRSRSNKDDQ